MKIKIVLISFLLIINTYSQISISEEIIEDGIQYKKIINTTDTLLIDILKINLSSNKYELGSVKANNLLNEKETTSLMVKSIEESGSVAVAPKMQISLKLMVRL